MIHANCYYASLELASHVIYIYMSEAVPIDRQSVVCDWWKQASHVAAVRMLVLQLWDTLN